MKVLLRGPYFSLLFFGRGAEGGRLLLQKMLFMSLVVVFLISKLREVPRFVYFVSPLLNISRFLAASLLSDDNPG